MDRGQEYFKKYKYIGGKKDKNNKKKVKEMEIND